MTFALVLGGGGVTGVAWETGLLKGLRDRGADLTTADVIVGTSAGAVVGAQISTGVDLDWLYEQQLATVNLAVERSPDVSRLTAFFGSLASDPSQRAMPVLTPEVLAQIGSEARAAVYGLSEAQRLEIIRSRLPVKDWPDRRLLLTAIDTEDGSFLAWDRYSGVDLPVAVASSCAAPWVYPPVTIKGRRYMDGGMRSTTNADVAADYETVMIIAPIGHLTGAMEAEIAQLRDAGRNVEAIVPNAQTLDAIGPNALEPTRRPGAARAGLAQAGTISLESVREAIR